ncbi:pentatricopeptide repeat-containing protein At1g71460, chloroplastic-like [Aristolochia californica]|uniref:pentatricopeptide repeat-containing protein At1g71460, chloroplastic-like n=1 Tax=Aristolochia californica TaxID=171875 RepID=UPI0035DCCF6B
MDAGCLLLLPQNLPKSGFHLSNPSNPISTSCSLKTVKINRGRLKTLKFKDAHLFPQSLPLHTKNPHVVYKNIQGFARKGKLKEALTILDYLEKEGIPVNATTFSSLLTACTRLKSLIEGKQIHVHIRINGLEKNEFLCAKLVEMYTSCGCTENAKQIFDEMPNQSVYPWNALLRGSVLKGHRSNQEMLQIYSRMRELGVELNEYTFSCLIKSFAGTPALKQGKKAHALLVKNGLLSSSVLLMTSLIDMYCKCGKIRLAWQLFSEIEERDVVAWGAMIAGFAHNRLRWEALEFTRRMSSEGIQPNSVILTMILPVIGEVPARRLGQEVHAYVIKTKHYSKQQFIESALIDMYCKCGDMSSGRMVFYTSIKRNTVLWTALMSGYASNGRLEQAMRSILWMQQEGIKPDIVSIATVLPVCGELKALKQGKELHAYIVKNWFLPNISISTSLIVMYSKCQRLESACNVFDAMEKKNIICWTAMIESYLNNGCSHDALRMFRSMQDSKQRPDSVAMARMLDACGALSYLILGKELHGQLLKRDMDLVPFVTSAIIKFYGKCGEIQKSKLVFDGIPARGSLTWTAIIEAYGCAGLHREALDQFKRMISKGFEPNHFTFRVVLSICSTGGFVDEAIQLFNYMRQKQGIKASEEHYTCITDLLNRAGRVLEAERFTSLRSAMA